MTTKEYQAEYERIERCAKAGLMSWEAACARIALLSIQFERSNHEAKGVLP